MKMVNVANMPTPFFANSADILIVGLKKLK